MHRGTRRALVLLAVWTCGVVGGSSVQCETEQDLDGVNCTVDMLPEHTLLQMLDARGFDGTGLERHDLARDLQIILSSENASQTQEAAAASDSEELMGPIEEDFIRCGTGEGMAYMEDPLPAEYSDAQEEEEPHATGHAHTHQAFQHLGAGAVGADVIEDADDDVKTHQIFGKVRSDSSDGAPAPGTGGAQEPTPDEEGDGQQQEQQLQGPHTIAGAIFDTVKELVVEVGAQMGRDADWLASLLPAEVQKPLRSAASLVSRHVRTVATPVVEQATRHGAKLISAGAKVTGTVRDRVGPKGKEAFDAARRGARGLVKKAQAFGKTGDGKGKTAEQESETKEDSEGTGGQ